MKYTLIFIAAFIALANFGTTQTTALRPVRINPVQISGYTFVVSETPAQNGQTWTLANAPVAGSDECYENGLRQHPGQSYTIAGAVITSPYWLATDDILCNYRW